MPERIEIARRVTTSAHVLNGNMEPVTSKPDRMRIHHSGGNVSAVRLTHEQGWPRPGTRRIVMVGDENSLIFQLAFQCTLEPHATSAIDKRHDLCSVARHEVVHRK